MEKIIPSEKMNLDELFRQKKTTEEHKVKMYQKILNRVHKKIKYASGQRGNEQFCCYVLPEFVLGIPKYDVATCNSYIIQNLQENGFKIKYTHPNLLFISWKHYIPDYERRAYKKATGQTIDGFGNLVQRKDKKRGNDDTNSLLLNRQKMEGPVSLIAKKEEDNNKFKKINSYKPTGKLIYNEQLVRKIEDKIN
jgi:hypothetical protein